MTQYKGKNKSVAVLGYGSQGRSIALNLKDSGYQVHIGLPAGSKSRRKAKIDGFEKIAGLGDVVQEADIICFALPDHLQGRLYQHEIKPFLNSEKPVTFWFLHGLAIHFNFIQPTESVDVILIAPHAPGVAVREKFLTDKSISAFYAIERNASGRAEQTIFKLAKAVGFKKSKLVKTTFEHEAIGDLFGEQAVLCGGMSELILNGYKTLTENGVPDENAYLEVAYQLDLIIDLIKKHGIEGMYKRISVAARYGSVNNGKKIISADVKKRMARLYENISSGSFARRLNRLDDKDVAKLDADLADSTDTSFEKAAKKFSK